MSRGAGTHVRGLHGVVEDVIAEPEVGSSPDPGLGTGQPQPSEHLRRRCRCGEEVLKQESQVRSGQVRSGQARSQVTRWVMKRQVSGIGNG